MKQECSTYLKSNGKSKALAATLTDTKLKDDSDNKDNGILNAFIAIVNLTKGIVEDVTKKKTWWSLSLRRWMIKMISTSSTIDRKSTRLNSSHCVTSRMPSSA